MPDSNELVLANGDGPGVMRTSLTNAMLIADIGVASSTRGSLGNMPPAERSDRAARVLLMMSMVYPDFEVSVPHDQAREDLERTHPWMQADPDVGPNPNPNPNPEQ